MSIDRELRTIFLKTLFYSKANPVKYQIIMPRKKAPGLTAGQQQIVQRIRRLHKAKKPLNISAVRRYYPGLIRKAHLMKPFWSWKEALAAAGLRYSRIRKELLPVCECRYCGEEKINLGSHLYIVHDVYPKDYLQQFPEEDLVSEEMRADKSRMSSVVLAHWEPLWTPEYVLERAHEFRKKSCR